MDGKMKIITMIKKQRGEVENICYKYVNITILQ
jgi:hypothetical protein